MKYYKRKIGKLIVSLIVTLAIISGSFYYGLSNYVSYAQANETEVTVPDEPEISGGAVPKIQMKS